MRTAPATEISEYSRRYVYTIVGAFAFGWAVLSVDIAVINPLLPLVRTEFQLSGAGTGLLTWAFTLPYLLIQIPSGVLADRLGAKRFLVVMTLVSAVGMMALGLWSYGLPALVASAVVNRLGMGVYYPTAFGVAMGSVPTTMRGTASALLVMGMALGSALGLALAVPLCDLGGNNWRFPMLVFGLLTLTLPLIFQTVMRQSKPLHAVTSRGVTEALRHPHIVLLLIMNFFTNYAFSVVMVWGPSFISSERGLSLATAGFYIALVNLIGFPSSLVSGVLSDRIGRRYLTMLLFPVAGTALVALASLGEPTIVLAAIVVFGLTGKWTPDVLLAAWMGDHLVAKYPSHAKVIYGVANTARMSAGVLAPPITGVLLDATGTLSTGFFVAGAVLFAAACLGFLVAERRQGTGA